MEKLLPEADVVEEPSIRASSCSSTRDFGAGVCSSPLGDVNRPWMKKMRRTIKRSMAMRRGH